MATIKTLSCDLETYSSADLTKCGVYRYAESPDFEILLFAYSINEEPVQVVDVACGEEVPDKILAALADNSVEKWAYNSQFERVCLSYWLHRNYPRHFKSSGFPEDSVGNYLDPAAWKCSRIWGAYMGLPLSLKGIGAILKLDEQKMEEGADLIKYFCKPCRPTKKNGGRTRNLPKHDMSKWEIFKEYNKRDVEVELAIKAKLANFPVPDFVWDEYHLDQELNDRGILVDTTLVEQAIAIDAKTKQSLRSRMQETTGLENPNSVTQMKDWLSGIGIEAKSLDKKAVQELLSDANADDNVTDVLTCRQQLAKASVSKYRAMQQAVCADGRARGMFAFYGANRTGRWCLTGDHEVLTPEGWIRLDEWCGGLMACWNSASEAVSFQEARKVSFPYDGPMYTYTDNRIDQCSTPDHKMRVQKRSDWMDMTVEEMSHISPAIPLTGYRYHRGCANPLWIRVLIMTQADGHYKADGAVRFHFKKQRKIERCKHLLRKAEIAFVTNNYKDGSTITIPARAVPLWLREFRSKTFGFWLLDENPDIFFDELPYWDGSCPAPNSIQYTTCNKQNADIVQALAHMSGRTASIRLKKAKKDSWNDAYAVNIHLTPKNCHVIRNKPSVTDFSGTVYCAVTKTGYFLVRRNGKVWVTGNSGKIIQLQNLPQNHMPDLKEARDLVRDGNFEALELLYDNIPNVLSELIRTAFVPRPGYKYIVSDFSAIEARVLSFLAGEQWRNDLFKTGGDIYCMSASQMFGVPVAKNGVNAHLRQKGKIAELACLSFDSPVLTDHGLVPIQSVTTDMKVWDGEEWVSHEGVVYRGEREVITYDGLTATPDHLVFVEGQRDPIRFELASSRGYKLVQTGDGERAIRLSNNHIGGANIQEIPLENLCVDEVSDLQLHFMERAGRIEKTSEKEMHSLPSKEDPQMARTETDSGKAKMRESKRQRVSELWCKRDKVQLSKCNRSGTLSDPGVWLTRQEDGNRPNRHKQRLCTWESSVCGSSNKLRKSEKECPEQIRSAVLAVCPQCSDPETGTGPNSGRDHNGCRDGSVRKEEELAYHKRTARLYDIRNAGPHHRFTVSGKLVHNCGYGGSIGALKSMGALEMGLTEDELQPLVTAWREANPHITRFWWDVDAAVKKAVMYKTSVETHGFRFYYKCGMLFIDLPSGRRLSYVKPKIGMNRFGSDCVTYEGINLGKWTRLETYGPKITENLVQAVSRDILAFAMKNLRDCFIVGSVHDELIIECSPDIDLHEVCEQMGRTPPWLPGIQLRADGYECQFYMKS